MKNQSEASDNSCKTERVGQRSTNKTNVRINRPLSVRSSTIDLKEASNLERKQFLFNEDFLKRLKDTRVPKKRSTVNLVGGRVEQASTNHQHSNVIASPTKMMKRTPHSYNSMVCKQRVQVPHFDQHLSSQQFFLSCDDRSEKPAGEAREPSESSPLQPPSLAPKPFADPDHSLARLLRTGLGQSPLDWLKEKLHQRRESMLDEIMKCNEEESELKKRISLLQSLGGDSLAASSYRSLLLEQVSSSQQRLQDLHAQELLLDAKLETLSSKAGRLERGNDQLIRRLRDLRRKQLMHAQLKASRDSHAKDLPALKALYEQRKNKSEIERVELLAREDRLKRASLLDRLIEVVCREGLPLSDAESQALLEEVRRKRRAQA